MNICIIWHKFTDALKNFAPLCTYSQNPPKVVPTWHIYLKENTFLKKSLIIITIKKWMTNVLLALINRKHEKYIDWKDIPTTSPEYETKKTLKLLTKL